MVGVPPHFLVSVKRIAKAAADEMEPWHRKGMEGFWGGNARLGGAWEQVRPEMRCSHPLC